MDGATSGGSALVWVEGHWTLSLIQAPRQRAMTHLENITPTGAWSFEKVGIPQIRRTRSNFALRHAPAEDLAAQSITARRASLTAERTRGSSSFDAV
jgi:hypothetical protein